MNGKKVAAVTLILAIFSFSPNRSAAATITVDSIVDEWDAGSCAEILPGDLPGPDGQTSLREAMCAANNNPGEDFISFAIPGAGVHTIEPIGPLPPLTDDSTTIDGYTQPGSSPATNDIPAKLLIEIDCTHLTGHNCIEITSSNNFVKGLVINRAGLYGIAIGYPTATYNQVSGNYLGTDPLGATALPNGVGGVLITEGASHNLIGGIDPADRNIISGNGWDGVSIYSPIGAVASSVNMVLGNYLGLDAYGTTAVPNVHNGARIYGNSNNNTIGINVISGNGYHGVMLEGELVTYNSVSANYIGLTADGMSAEGNFFHGIIISDGAKNNTIGGADMEAGNVIAGNGNYGILLTDPGTDNNMLINNLIGTGPDGVTDLGWQQFGVAINYGACNNILAGGTIAYHSHAGVHIYNPPGGTTLGNQVIPLSVFDNDYGIDLEGEGANGDILPPEITNISRDGANVTIEGTAQPEQNIVIYTSFVDQGQGKVVVGIAQADASGYFSFTGSSLIGRYFNATATTTALGTSEFSATYDFPIYGIYLPITRQ